MRRKTICLALLAVCLLTFPTRAFGLDKQLKLLFKAARWGATAGVRTGAGAEAMARWGDRIILMGASAHRYAGSALAAYISATQPEEKRGPGKRQNPYAPRRPVGPDDYEDDEEQIQEMVPERDRPGASLRTNAEWLLA